MSITAKTHFLRLIAALFGVSLLASAAMTSFALAEGPMKGADFIRVVPDQMHQLQVVKVETRAFRTQRSAIGQIGYNEEASTIVLTPFSGRVIRLIAKLGEQVKKGDPLLEIDSPEQLVPQNDFIAAQAAKRKASSQHNLAVIAEKRVRDLHEGKAAPSKDLQRPRRSLPALSMICGRPTPRSKPPASGCGSSAGPMRKFKISSRTPRSTASPRSRRRSAAPSSRARSGRDNTSKPIRTMRCIRSPISRRCG